MSPAGKAKTGRWRRREDRRTLEGRAPGGQLVVRDERHDMRAPGSVGDVPAVADDLAPILISFSRRVVNDHSVIVSEIAACGRSCQDCRPARTAGDERHSARHGLRWFEIDMTWWHVKVLAFLRLADRIKVPSRAKQQRLRDAARGGSRSSQFYSTLASDRRSNRGAPSSRSCRDLLRMKRAREWGRHVLMMRDEIP